MSDKHIRSLSGFEKRWLKIFAAEVSKNDIEKYVLESGPFIWHVFSFGLIAKDTYLKGDAARNAFDEANKNGATYFKPFAPKGSPNPKYRSPNAEELEQITECYVIAADKSWTYVKTHEDQCGPYFCRSTIQTEI